MDLVVKQRRVQIEKIYAKKNTCPQIVANEAEICRQKVTIEMDKVRVHKDDEIELVHENSEENKIKIIIDYDNKEDAIVAEKRKELNAIRTERDQVLRKMEDSRHACHDEGQEKVETCKEEIEGRLIVVRRERDTLLDQLTDKREADMERITSVHNVQVVKVQTRLEDELAQLHDQRDHQLTELKTTCQSSTVVTSITTMLLA